MRRDGRNDQGVVFPSPDEIPRLGERILVRFGIGRGVLHDGLATHRAEARPGRCLGHVFLKIVHVIEGGHAASDQLGAGNRGSQLDELRRHVLALNGHHVAHQPNVQPQVICEAAQQHHGHMRMCVDQTGHEDSSTAIDDFIRLIFRTQGGFVPDCHDAVARHDNGAGIVLVKFIVHGQYMGVGEHKINRLHVFSRR